MAKSLKIDGQEILAVEKTFSTGSTGYWAGGKVTLEGKVYQVSASIVLVGSKPANKPAPRAPVK